MNDEDQQRQWSEVQLNDPELIIYLAGIDDLVRLNDEAKRHLWGAKWSSTEALRRQVEGGAMCVICPVFRNGGSVDEPESFRCFVWFIEKPEGRGRVSLLDVGTATLAGLRRASSPDRLTRIVRALMDGFELARID
ncbi:hypothetical protein OG792_11530 [Micromonospora sp. NBC_01699]|uniref:hypothetical protein n=1 Tax=Micromonospora sp. NBC_01699 TaxID=2975984 RepID=UPI002E325B93|nr:hypothetical protein [Micromonospora sp. NBC_01699]